MYEPYYDGRGKFSGVILGDASIPKVAGNREWRKFLAWYAEQNPVPFSLDDIAPPEPTEGELDRAALVAAYQQIGTDLAAIQAGKQAAIDTCDQIIAGPTNPTNAQLAAGMKLLAGVLKQNVQATALLAEDGDKARKGVKMMVGA